MPNRFALLLLSGSIVCTNAAAATDLPSEADYFGPLPVVLTATRLTQPLRETPASVTVIDRQMIDASGARSLEELFRLVPGMIVGHENGHIAFVTYHAFADRYARRMQVLIDGRSVYTPTFGGVNWSTLPVTLDDIERIEVIRGPDASSYGTNAVLGTISIFTRAPGSRAPASARLSAGEDGIFRVQGHASGHSENLDYGLNVARWGDHGFSEPEQREDSSRTSLVRLRVDYGPDPGHQLSFQAGGTWQDARTGSKPSDLLGPPHDDNATRSFQQASYTLDTSLDSEWKFSVYHIREDYRETVLSNPIPVFGGARLLTDKSAAGDRIDVEAQQTVRVSPTLRYVWGLGNRWDRLKSPSYLSRPDWAGMRIQRLFGNLEWKPWERWAFNGGLMVEHNSESGYELSPRLAMNYQLSANHTLRLAGAMASRMPILIEDKANQQVCIGNLCDIVFATDGGLDSERIKSFEVGYLGQFFHDELSVDLRLFDEQVYHIIGYYFPPYPADHFDGTVYDFHNYDRLQVHGAETQIQYQPSADTRIIANYAYTRLGSTDHDEHYGSSGPKHSGSLLVSQRVLGRVEASLMYFWYGRYHGIDTGDDLPPQDRLDVKLSMPLGSSRNAPTLSLVYQGIDGGYVDFRKEAVFRPRFYASLHFTF